eukprot:CAMPEP_0170533406 /NCGR_PEP_ID=MMETSP0209-20121228/81953_1 /TAXON_ID=665100 ORGANISM="Litonotus pictus, Strain P1" /NCGR_SAMPLE_ID=MMETSP0209 /ASSEMBLY_ACC=CAM_ASM_000301 /LENGTH=46 /DNA_ID= /DNA_START= /DNA_END= /DNA_ORIENTATION=
MGLFLKNMDYYKETNSNTYKLRFVNLNFIVTKDKDFYSQVVGAQQE